MKAIAMGACCAVLANGAVVLLTSISTGSGSLRERVKCQAGNLGMLLAGAISTVGFAMCFQQM